MARRLISFRLIASTVSPLSQNWERGRGEGRREKGQSALDPVTTAALISFMLLVAAWLELPASPDPAPEPIENVIARPHFGQVEAAGEERAS